MTIRVHYLLRQINHLSRRLIGSFGSTGSSPDIILTGNQKSGTSAIAALLSEAVGHPATIDVFPKMGMRQFSSTINGQTSFKGFAENAKLYLSSSIVKDPDFAFFLPELFELYPEASYVFIVRNPHDNIRSILNRISSAKSSEEVCFNDISATSRSSPLWGMMFDKDLMPYEVDGIVRTLAHRWNYTYQLMARHQDNLLIVSYEDFLKDKEEYIRKLAWKLGYSELHSISHIVDKQYQPKGHSRRKHYFSRSHREQIENICGNYADRVAALNSSNVLSAAREDS